MARHMLNKHSFSTRENGLNRYACHGVAISSILVKLGYFGIGCFVLRRSRPVGLLLQLSPRQILVSCRVRVELHRFQGVLQPL